MDSKTIILITGSNSGIGYQTAAILASASPNYHIILTSRSPSRGETALSDLRALHPSTSFTLVPLDVTSEASITAAFETVSKSFGRLDVLINNAGIISHSPHYPTSLRETFETNTFGPFVVTETFLPLLLKSNSARLIYVSSDLGSLTARSNPKDPNYKLPATAYRMSKSALNMLAACHAQALGPQGVKVWTYCPGYVVTNLSGTGEKGVQERIKNGAGDPKDSARGILGIVDGKRDADVGKFVNKDRVLEW